ncbi:MAG: hypothetical protein ACI8ZM_000304 [Crocinitomix sp.]|jgi:hypothetical protein
MRSIFLVFIFTCIAQPAHTTRYTQLSNQFNIEVAVRVNATNNPDFASTYLRIRILEKDSKNVIQTIRKKHFWIPNNLYTDRNHSRSYSTGFNADNIVVDDNFGDVVIADLNFDGLDDFAVTYDHGVSNGNHYYFYFQRHNKTFYRQVFLTEEMVLFPAVIDYKNKRLTTRTAAGANNVGERVFQYNSEKNSWFLLSTRLLN